MQSVRALFTWGARTFFRDAEEWGLTRRAALVIALVPLAIIACLVVISALSFVNHDLFRPVFRWVTAEDSLLEWGQFLCVFISAGLFTIMGFRLLRMGQYGIGLLYVLIGLSAFFVAGEEISWGQRVFGWSTPEALDEINHQGETNVHNIRWVQALFGYVVLLGGMYGTVTPLLALRFPGKRPRTLLNFLLIPPLCTVPAFMMPFGYRTFRALIWPETDFMVVKFGEAPELCLYIGLLVFAWLNMRHLRQAADEKNVAQVASPV